MKIVVCIPHSHTWFWTQSCLASLFRFPPRADDYEVEIVVVNNSPWSPASRGVTDVAWYGSCFGLPESGILNGAGIRLHVVDNHKENKFHASALDCVVETFDFDYLMALETDVLALRPDWLQWFVDQMRETDYAVGHQHHEHYLNPSCTLYRGSILRAMQIWCKANPEPTLLRWGAEFRDAQEIAARDPSRDYRDWYGSNIEWIAGPFADKRGWPAGTVLRETPSGQQKGPGWYEPGQMLHHWAVEAGYTYTFCQTQTTQREDTLPLQTLYGGSMHGPPRQMEVAELLASGARTAHMWGGTRALDIVKHEVTCNFVRSNTPFWLEREARFWRDLVPPDTRAATLALIRQYGWHYKGANGAAATDRDRAAVQMIRECYARGGVEW